MQISISGEQHDSVSCVEFDIDENRVHIYNGFGESVMIESAEQCQEVIDALETLMRQFK